MQKYIGARYVPLPMGAWDATIRYEPLSIVTYGNSSYISRTTVPAGTTPANTEYWMLNFEPGGIISDVEEKVDELTTKMDTVYNLTVPTQTFDKYPVYFHKIDVTDDGTQNVTVQLGVRPLFAVILVFGDYLGVVPYVIPPYTEDALTVTGYRNNIEYAANAYISGENLYFIHGRDQVNKMILKHVIYYTNVPTVSYP